MSDIEVTEVRERLWVFSLFNDRSSKFSLKHVVLDFSTGNGEITCL